MFTKQRLGCSFVIRPFVNKCDLMESVKQSDEESDIRGKATVSEDKRNKTTNNCVLVSLNLPKTQLHPHTQS